MNFLFGLLVIFYSIQIPDLGRATEQQKNVASELYQYIFIVMLVVLFFNLINLWFNRKDRILVLGYMVAIISSSFYVFDMKLIAILYILAAFLIEIQVLRENVIVQTNTFYLIILSIAIAAIGLVAINCFTYKDKVNKLTKIENIDKIEYDEEFFKYVSELDDHDLYFNVQKDGKWGYINYKGEQKIDYKYDYASCFVEIEKFNKKFEVALVCSDDTANLILKNERVVFSYKNDVNVNDLEGQYEKLKMIYKDILKQEGDFESFIKKPITENFTGIEAYPNESYRYPYNQDYDIGITISQNGKNRYEFVKKGSDTTRVSINCDYLPFDEKYLYVYSNGYLPFYWTSENIQGWYTVGTERVEIEGNVQILEFYGDKILVKDYNEGKYYFIDTNKKIISPKYLDIYVYDKGYIVRYENGIYAVVDKEFNEIMNLESNIVDTSFLDMGILICGNIPEYIEFNEYNLPTNLSYKLININERAIIGEGFNNLYCIINKKSSTLENFIDDITDVEYHFIGEKYYIKE